MTKGEIFGWVIDRYCEPLVRVLEIGRMRNTGPAYEKGDGWSTLHFARNGMVGMLYSIDNDPKTLEVCSKYPELSTGLVVFSGSVENLCLPPIDFLYLDAENDAEATVRHYHSVTCRLRGTAEKLDEIPLILIDDVYSLDGNKGDLIIPLLEKEGYEIEQIYPMALAKRR